MASCSFDTIRMYSNLRSVAVVFISNKIVSHQKEFCLWDKKKKNFIKPTCSKFLLHEISIFDAENGVSAQKVI